MLSDRYHIERGGGISTYRHCLPRIYFYVLVVEFYYIYGRGVQVDPEMNPEVGLRSRGENVMSQVHRECARSGVCGSRSGSHRAVASHHSNRLLPTPCPL